VGHFFVTSVPKAFRDESQTVEALTSTANCVTLSFAYGQWTRDVRAARGIHHEEEILTGRKKILLADDVNFFLELEKSFLQREEIDILMAGNGQEAYELIAKHRPEVVLLDLYMPEMNGDECCRRVKSDPGLRDIPVVMVTTAGKPEEQDRCRKAGCDEILLKPIHRHDFLEMVRRHLNVVERVLPRSPVRMQVLYGKENLLEDYSVNLSAGGLFLETANPLAPEEPLTLTFHLPEQDPPICCQGLVAWVNSPGALCNPALPSGMGIKFVDLDLEHLYQIRTFLKTCGPAE
jgi:uncharacterized protein (TIGR02266 family)